MGLAAAILLRLLVPLSIFRVPVAGVFASMLADSLDVVLGYGLGMPASPEWAAEALHNYYPHFDKFFDTYYLSIVLYKSLEWEEPLARRTSVFLFVWRLFGVIPIYLGQSTRWLLLFANVFENYYLFYAIAGKWWPGWRLRTGKRLALVLLLVGTPKLIQEYFFHVLDITPWPWLQKTFFG
jgi:hypothetical protein